MRRIGIDVGGTNTDAVLIDGSRVLAAVKTTTTADVLGGVRTALDQLLAQTAHDPGSVAAVVIGTTHFTNAVIERRVLQRVGALRIGLPASASLPPFIDWPDDLATLVRGQVHMVAGGHEYDGRPIVPLDLAAIRDAARRMADAGLTSVGVTSVFSPLTAECEQEAARILAEEMPGAAITLSHELGRIGLLERENVTLLNACLQEMAHKTVAALTEALRSSGLSYQPAQTRTLRRRRPVDSASVVRFVTLSGIRIRGLGDGIGGEGDAGQPYGAGAAAYRIGDEGRGTGPPDAGDFVCDGRMVAGGGGGVRLRGSADVARLGCALQRVRRGRPGDTHVAGQAEIADTKPSRGAP